MDRSTWQAKIRAAHETALPRSYEDAEFSFGVAAGKPASGLRKPVPATSPESVYFVDLAAVAMVPAFPKKLNFPVVRVSGLTERCVGLIGCLEGSRRRP